ncbi:glycosyltransferase family 39 protein [Candidatus Woesearchaeota archaeon]|nr:glycosyltransferase family 39 protein [Candidatus Woesearchaeota archaeon]
MRPFLWLPLAFFVAFVALQLPFLLVGRAFFWDEAVYLGMGKHLYSFGAAGLWEPLRPVGLPLVLGAFWLLGSGFVVYRAVMLGFAVGVLLLVYLVGRRFMGGFALVSVAAVAFSPVFFDGSARLLSDVPSVFFALAALYFFVRGSDSVSGFFAALAFIFRYPHGLVVVSVLFFSAASLFYVRRISHRAFFVSFAVALAPFLLANQVFLGGLFSPYMDYSQYQANSAYAVDGFFANAFFYLAVLLRNSPFLLFFIPGAVLFFRKEQGRLLLLPVLMFAYLAYFTLIVNKQERFAIAFLPFAALLSGYWLREAFVFSRSRMRVFAWPLLVLVVLLCLLSSLRGSLQSYGGMSVQSPGVYGFFSQYPGAVVLTSDPGFVMFSDNLFLWYYEDPWSAADLYSRHLNDSDFVVFSPDFFPCDRFGHDCGLSKQLLLEAVSVGNSLVLNGSWGGREFYVFRTGASLG